MDVDRRGLLTLAAAVMASPPVAAAAQPLQPPAGRPPAPPPAAPAAIIPLWPAAMPGRVGGSHTAPARPTLPPTGAMQNVDAPALWVYPAARPDGRAVIICPGGGYFMLSVASEGSEPALKLNQAGITAFVLTYRLPGEGWANQSDVPLQDAQRAVRLVRSRAAEFGVDPARLGVMGFSAGGHVAATLANLHAHDAYAPIDAADRQSAKPAFAGLIYPVITMKDAYTFRRGVPLLLGEAPTETMIAARSNELLVSGDTPPCFLAHAMDDSAVPVENSLMMLSALRAHKVPCEAHLFQEGRHGFGLGKAGQPNELWLDLFVRWTRRAVATPA